jgi:outer membrane protein, multidrug efflux system
MRILIVCCTLLCLAGCRVGPKYCPPKMCVPNEWHNPVSCDSAPACWWEIFNDPLLNKYIQQAAQCNKDIQSAEANIFQARAARQVAAAPLFPKISVDYDAFRIFLSKNGLVDALFPEAARERLGLTPPSYLSIYNNFIDASWELDIFGKTQRSIEAAQAELQSTIEKRSDLLITIFGEIARNYIELRSYQSQKELLERNIALLKTNVEIYQTRYTSGYSNLSDLEQVEIQLNQAVSQLPSVNSAIYTNIYSISVLTGCLPETLLEELLPKQPLPLLPDCLSAGVRSDLLRRRPDIREAERNLAQSYANIGVAIASFYPTFTLAGFLGLQSLKISNLFTPRSKTYIYGADVSLPVFQGGRLRGNLKMAEAQAAALALTYQQTVLNAVREAESALVSYNEDHTATEEFKQIVAKNKTLFELTHQRFINGLSGQLDASNSELILNNARISLLQSETSTLLDLVTLYKALGGGWEPFNLCATVE